MPADCLCKAAVADSCEMTFHMLLDSSHHAAWQLEVLVLFSHIAFCLTLHGMYTP